MSTTEGVHDSVFTKGSMEEDGEAEAVGWVVGKTSVVTEMVPGVQVGLTVGVPEFN